MVRALLEVQLAGNKVEPWDGKQSGYLFELLNLAASKAAFCTSFI